ncbi:MAG: 30S ribosome-binding factor RbfA [Nitrospinota bacterium]|nr:30S ribosome-binding factor RbfA [Nitrospinota bacterium]
MRRFSRADRLSEEIIKNVASIIMEEMRDPRLGGMISITRAEVSKDLKYATLYVSVFGSVEEKTNAKTALSRGAGFIRGRLGEKLRVRVLPQLRFKMDDSIEHGARIAELLKKAEEESGGGQNNNNPK